MEKRAYGLTKRHGMEELGLDGYIWGDKIDEPLNFAKLRHHANKWVRDEELNNEMSIKIYVTGLTAATLAVAQALVMADFTMFRFMHWNRDTNSYEEQWFEVPPKRDFMYGVEYKPEQSEEE